MPFLRVEQPSLANQIGPSVGRMAGSFLRSVGGASNRQQAMSEIAAIPTDLDPAQYTNMVGSVLGKYGLEAGNYVANALATQRSVWDTKRTEALQRQTKDEQAAIGQQVGDFLRAQVGGDSVAPEPFVMGAGQDVVPLAQTEAAGSRFLRAQQQADTQAEQLAKLASSGSGAGTALAVNFLRDAQSRATEAAKAAEDKRRYEQDRSFQQDKFNYLKDMDNQKFEQEVKKAKQEYYLKLRAANTDDWQAQQQADQFERKMREEVRQYNSTHKLNQQKLTEAERAARATEGIAATKAATEAAKATTDKEAKLSDVDAEMRRILTKRAKKRGNSAFLLYEPGQEIPENVVASEYQALVEADKKNDPEAKRDLELYRAMEAIKAKRILDKPLDDFGVDYIYDATGQGTKVR